RDKSRIVVPKLTEEIAEIKNKMDIIVNDKELTEDEKALSGAVLQEKLSRLEKQRHSGSRLSAQVRNRLEGEVISTYWTQINKPHKPRDIINRLRKGIENIEDSPQYETNSKNMADMARQYHNSLQNDQTGVPRAVREAKTTTVLGRVARQTTEEQKELLKKKLTLEDVRYALRKSANFKAPGLNGITYEVWKILDQRYESAKANDKRAFNILRVLLRVYNDIEKYGVVKVRLQPFSFRLSPRAKQTETVINV
ncbi:hypothetical protein R3P38DRAFT_2553515, partial [Favolaschia claudopus]